MKIKRCSSCIFNRSGDVGHGAYVTSCCHPNSPNGYDSIIPKQYDKFPTWCPLRTKKFVLSLDFTKEKRKKEKKLTKKELKKIDRI
jgi:hypothetical protein